MHLEERGADPNVQHDDGFSPLMTASEAGHAEVLETTTSSRSSREIAILVQIM